MSSVVGTPMSDPTLISDGMFCPRATCSRYTVPPVICANLAVRFRESSGES